VGEAAAAAGREIDDGGCDLSYGYLQHSDVAAARAAAAAALGGDASRLLAPAVAVSAAGLAALSPAAQQQLERGLRRTHPGAHSALSAASVGADSPFAAAAGERSLLSAVERITLVPCHVLTSRLRSQLTALHNQSDYIGALAHVNAAVSRLQAVLPTVDLSVFGIDPATGVGPDVPGSAAGVFPLAYNYTSDNEHAAWMAPAPGGAAFPYSLTFVYYSQYQFIRGVAVWNALLTIGVVYAAAYLVTSSLAVAAATAAMVACVTVDVVGFVWLLNPRETDPNGQGPYGVDINAVSVVNLVAAIGLAVEFGVHIASYYSHATVRRRVASRCCSKRAVSFRRPRSFAALVSCRRDAT
jgi:hypothetical protein